MRDNLCIEDDLIETIESNEDAILEELEEMELLKEDIKNGVKRYPRENEDIIADTKSEIFQWIEEEIRAKYSLGLKCSELEELVSKAITYMTEIGYNEIGYVNMIQIISLGILLEISQDMFEKLVSVADVAKVDDILVDCLFNAYGIDRELKSSMYERETPYKEAVEIIELSNSDKTKATTKLEEYVQKKWLKGHSDYGWTKAHKEAGYYGLWSFEAAAIAKIFNLDDSKLKNDNHYPYDLAHYKDDMTFNKVIVLTKKELAKDVQNEKFIPENPELEQIIPNEFRDEINQLLVDFSSLEDKDFWNKYNLMELWYTADDYQMDKNDKHIIGNIVINQLVSLGYILQLDYKEDIEDYVDNMKNYWKDSEVKLICFELDNDQNYYVKVPVSCNLKNVYEVKIHE